MPTDNDSAADRRLVDLSVSNYGTVRSAGDYDAAILPWGATEPHNLHLPYMTDCLLSQAIGVDAARIAASSYGMRVMVMPPIGMGAQNPGQRELPFCIHARYETQKAILTDIVASLYHQGLRRLLILNGHGGNTFKPMIRDLAVDYPDMLIASAEWFKGANPKEYFDRPDDHAEELETSVMMHYHPDLVKLEEAGPGKARSFADPTLHGFGWIPRNWARVSDDTGIGDPSAATPEKGARFAAACADATARLLHAMMADNLYTE